MNNRLAKFKDLVPSTLPFVEGKMDGHKERKNYSIVGPGVAEDSKQFVKIAMPHSFNLGAVSAMPKNGSGLHSHTTAVVWLCKPEPFFGIADTAPRLKLCGIAILTNCLLSSATPGPTIE